MKNLFKKIVFLFIITLLTITNVYADYSDDLYTGNYSLEEMLKNYNLITFGKKTIDDNMTLDYEYYSGSGFGSYSYNNGMVAGDAKIFHVNGLFLVNGILNGQRIDGLKDSSSFYAYGKTISSFWCGVENATSCFLDQSSNPVYYYNSGSLNMSSPGKNSFVQGTYMNFDRLYENVISDQQKIKKGRLVEANNGVAHIEIGGEYYIDDIDNIDKIVFDNFDENDDKLTIITITKSGSFTFPLLFESGSGSEQNIPTNDYIGMNRPSGFYANYYVIDKYFGNIIWNVPNATYIELQSAPYAGHLIAPKADVRGPELHFGGNYIVNSIYLSGRSEAHYYPLTKNLDSAYKINTEIVSASPVVNHDEGDILFNDVDPETLEEGMVVGFTIQPKLGYVVDKLKIEDAENNNVSYEELKVNEYEYVQPATDVTIQVNFRAQNILDVLNPKTGTFFYKMLAFLFLSVMGFLIVKKRKKVEKI